MLAHLEVGITNEWYSLDSKVQTCYGVRRGGCRSGITNTRGDGVGVGYLYVQSMS